MKAIGIIGQGFVGTAIREGLKSKFDIETYDKFKDSSCSTLEELMTKTKMFFVCLPTPMRLDGSCDLSIIEEVIQEADKHSNGHIAIIKSTILPTTTERLNAETKNLSVVFSPEFLTEANYIDDFKNQNRIIIGGHQDPSTKVADMFKKAFPNVLIVKTEPTVAEMVKYFTNTFLATKVSFANEMRKVCANINIDYDKVLGYSLYDTRIGGTHLSVPGPDGQQGFGGSCFPKDINALIHFARSLGFEPTVLSSVWKKNLEVRPSRDWEKLKGRAVSEKD
jgi:UDPglucose 6-dehydrogenase|tara:strand:+ start:6969 stop:7805 length:837 start_codon:yes stop_codon:yes gene_type:complete